MKFDRNHRWVFVPADIKHEKFSAMHSELGKEIIGYNRERFMLLTTFTAPGHCLLMANSGLGKTKTAEVLPLIVKGMHAGIVQGTPDKMPASITGFNVVLQDGTVKWYEGELVSGPEGVNWLLIDESTRLTPRVWAALLQAMEGRKKTVEGQTYHMAPIFVVCLTANFPAPGEGTVELPNAVYDRILYNIQWGYPDDDGYEALIDRAQDLKLSDMDKEELRAKGLLKAKEHATGVITMEELVEMRWDCYRLAKSVTRDTNPDMVRYIRRLVQAGLPFLPEGHPEYNPEVVQWGATGGSPRFAMDLKMAAVSIAYGLDEKPGIEHVKAIYPEVAKAHMRLRDQAVQRRNPIRMDDIVSNILVKTDPFKG
jgi:MoxR-like ATPase